MPTYQESHVGLSLVADVLSQFKDPATREISVNTQDNNLKSLGLYKKLGFEFTEGNFPIYICKD
jgi:ribosomal protein S18 acetylase RimI-like enzyme